MLLDARTVADQTRGEVDICIVGGGVAGLALAEALLGSGATIAVLEAGGDAPHPEVDDQARGDLTGLPLWFFDLFEEDLASCRTRYLGGGSNRWAGYSRPFPERELAQRPGVRGASWPIGRAELDPWYDAAAQRMGLATTAFDPPTALAATATPGVVLEGGGITSDVKQLHKVAFADVRSTLEAAADAWLVQWATVTELVPTSDGTRVEEVVARTITGTELRIGASTVVLATGGIEVPRLLLASRGADPAGLANSSGLVGRCFAEHPHVLLGVARPELSPEDLLAYQMPEAREGLGGDPIDLTQQPAAQLDLRLDEATAETDGLLDHRVELIVLPTGTDVEVEGASGIDAPARLRLHEATGRPAPGATALMVQYCETRPDPDSRVTLHAQDVDALGMPRASLHWKVGAADRRRAWEAGRRFAERAPSAGLGPVRSAWGRWDYDPSVGDLLGGSTFVAGTGVDPWGWRPGIGWHHMGTTKMSGGAAGGVVDRDCRTHDVENLYVAGSSVFPTYAAIEPTFTILALALRLADHLASAP